MRLVRLVSAVVCALIGLVWLGQGVGLVRGSVMTGDPKWAVIGVVLLALASWQLVALAKARR